MTGGESARSRPARQRHTHKAKPQLKKTSVHVAAAMEAAGYAVPPPGDEEGVSDGPSSARGAAGAESQLQATSL